MYKITDYKIQYKSLGTDNLSIFYQILEFIILKEMVYYIYAFLTKDETLTLPKIACS